MSTTTRTHTAKPLVRAAFAASGTAAIRVAAGPVAGLWIVPDVIPLAAITLLSAAERGTAKGQLPTRIVPVYNAMHTLAGPALLAVAAVTTGHAVLLAAALAWFSHIAIDRALGYGLRTREGLQRG